MAAQGTKLITEVLSEQKLYDFPAVLDGRSERRGPVGNWPLLFATLDVLAIWSASVVALVAFLQVVPMRHGYGRLLTVHLGFLLLYSGLVPLICNTQRLYTAWLTQSRLDEILAVVKASLLATILLTACIYISGIKQVSREIILVTMVLGAAFMVCWRLLRREWAQRASADGITCHNVLIVGTHSAAQMLRHFLEAHPHLGYRFTGFLECSSRPGSETTHVLGTTSQVSEIARANFVDHVIVCAPDRLLVGEMLAVGREHGLHISVLPDLYDGLALGAPIKYLGGFPLIEVHQQHVPTVSLFVKRMFDIVMSGWGLIVLAPLLACIALAIKLTSSGPVFYTSSRVGRKGTIFGCHKFRTMVVNAEALKAKLHHLNERDGVLFKISNDPRITPVGRFLRKYSLDEIPQLWNVLKGNMSLVGPRPPIAAEVKQYQLEHLRRLNVTPGITGLWQVQARNDPSFESYIALDLEYVERWSLLADFKILFRTAQVVFTGTGS